MPPIWAEAKDTPVWTAGILHEIDPWHCGSWGKLYSFVMAWDKDNNRCGFQDVQSLVSCMMPKGHDTFHIAQTDEMLDKHGPLLVLSIQKGELYASPE